MQLQTGSPIQCSRKKSPATGNFSKTSLLKTGISAAKTTNDGSGKDGSGNRAVLYPLQAGPL